MTRQEKLTDVENIIRTFSVLNNKHTRGIGDAWVLEYASREKNTVQHRGGQSQDRLKVPIKCDSAAILNREKNSSFLVWLKFHEAGWSLSCPLMSTLFAVIFQHLSQCLGWCQSHNRISCKLSRTNGADHYRYVTVTLKKRRN